MCPLSTGFLAECSVLVRRNTSGLKTAERHGLTYAIDVQNLWSLLLLKTPRRINKYEGKVFPLQAWAGPWGSGRLRLLDFLDFRHYEGGKVVTLTHPPPLPTEVFWYSFLEAESASGHMLPSVASKKIPSDTTGDRSRDPPTSSAGALTTTLPQIPEE
jgi:hypothetical protein